MKSSSLQISRSVISSLYLALIAIVIFGFSSRNASAFYEVWTGNTSSDWDTTGNWGIVPSIGGTIEVPKAGDNALFNAQSPNMTVTFSLPAATGTTNQPFDILFSAAGTGYTIGSLSSTNGLTFADYRPIFIQSSLAGNGGSETIDAPIVAQSRFILGNFSPSTAAGLGINGVGGYNNTLIDNGSIAESASGSTLFFMGMGNIVVNGNISGTLLALNQDMTADATVTLSGTNSFTGGTSVGGKMVLDYTTNNTNKLSSTAQLSMGNNNRNGGNLTVTGNNSAATVQNVSNLFVGLGASAITVNGGTGAGASATLNLGYLNSGGVTAPATSQAAGAVVDFSNNSNGAITTTSGNGFTGTTAAPKNSINIIGQWATYDENSWATANQSGGHTAGTAYQGSDYAAYLKANPTAPTTATIAGLTVDNGDSFSSASGNYTVDIGGETLAYSSTAGANTIRFLSGGTLDLGYSTLNMLYGGIMVANSVSDDTEITDGFLSDGNVNGLGLDVYNYGTGTLTISANILSNTSFTKAGSGTVVLSGFNSNIVGQTITIDSGKLVMANAAALGSSNNLWLGDSTATLDLAGFNLALTSLNSDLNLTPGNQAAAAGFNSQIVNSVAGTISRITLLGNSGDNSANAALTTAVNGGRIALGSYYGGINEASGAIISFDLEKGAATSQIQFNLGTANPFGDPTGANGTAASGLTGANDIFTGSVTVGVGTNLGITGYSNIDTFGALIVNGLFGAYSNQNSAFGTTYLAGTGLIAPSAGTSLWVDTNGTVADTFAGNFGSSAGSTGVSLNVDGTGSLVLTNNVYAPGISIYGTSHLTLPGLLTANNFLEFGDSTVTLTGTSGTVGGGNIALYGGRLIIAPSGSNADVAVNSLGSSLTFDGEANIVLDKGANNSVTFTMGSATTAFALNGSGQDSDLIIGSAQGLAALGTTDKFTILSTGNKSPVNLVDGIVMPIPSGGRGLVAYAENETAGGPENATFLTYVGNGTSTDHGFTAYTFAANNINNINAGTLTSLEQITNAQTLTGNVQIHGLEIDKGGSLVTTGKTLTIGTPSAYGSVILNGASITGGITLANIGHVYTDLDNGSIGTVAAGGNDFAKDGDGTLFVTTYTSSGATAKVIVNGGALDLGTAVGALATNNDLYLHGGVIQGSGTYNGVLADRKGGVIFQTNNDYSNPLSGGFSARGGELDVHLTDINGSSNLIWGTTASFLQEGSVFEFGSTTSDSVVKFDNNMDFGTANNDNALFSRDINVTGNTADAGLDPLAVSDYTVLSGVLSSNTNGYAGLSKDGTGVLYLMGNNTYTGSTTIANGTLVIGKDSALGTAPTAAYALNSASTGGGGALTKGAIEINGGATLAADASFALSANRQILLASGATGATASNIDVESGDTLTFGGMIADYIGEVGSLQKEGLGEFDYSGTSLNTGTDYVSGGTFAVVDAVSPQDGSVTSGSINSVNSVVINNQSYTSPTNNSQATFEYSSSIGLQKAVSFGANGGNFVYDSATAYTGGPISVTNHAILSGTGNLGTTPVMIHAGGTLLPGHIDPTPGTLTMGALTFLTGGNENFLIADAAGIAGTGYSTVMASSLDLTSLNGTTPFNINLESLNGNVAGNAANFDPTQSYSFVLVSTTGGIQDNGISQAALNDEFAIYASANNGATGFSNPATGTWSVSQSGNDLLLDYTPGAVPEPSTYVLLGLGLVALVAISRYRKLNAL